MEFGFVTARNSPRARARLERRAELGQIKRTKTRAMLLNSAFDALGHGDGKDTQIDDVLAKAGMARGTFYNYFRSRDDLFAAISYELSHSFDVALAENHDPPTRSLMAIRTYLGKTHQDKKWGWAMVNISLNGPFVFGAATYEYARETIQLGIESGDFVLPSARHGLDLLMGTMLSAMMTLLRDEAGEAYIDEIGALILLGFGVTRKRVDRLLSTPHPVLPPTGEPFSAKTLDT